MSYLTRGRTAAERWLGPGGPAPRRTRARSSRWSAYLLAALVLPVGLYGLIGQHIPGGAVLAAIGLASLAAWWVMRPRYTTARAQKIGTLASLLTIAFTAAAEVALVLFLGSPASGVPLASLREAAIAAEAAIVLLVARLLASYWLRLPTQAAAATAETVKAVAETAAAETAPQTALPGVVSPATLVAAPQFAPPPEVLTAPQFAPPWEVLTAPQFAPPPQVVTVPEVMTPAKTMAGPGAVPAPWVAAAARAVAAARAAAAPRDDWHPARPAAAGSAAAWSWLREHRVLVGTLVALLMVLIVVGLVAAVVVVSVSGVASS
jgi:hypothetical protein